MSIILSSDVHMLTLSGVTLSSKVYLHTLCGFFFLNYPHCHSLVETSLTSKQHTGRSLHETGQHNTEPFMAYSSLEMSAYSFFFFFPSGYAPLLVEENLHAPDPAWEYVVLIS